MTLLSSFLHQIRAFRRSEQIHQEIADELQFHMDSKMADLMRSGISPEQARATAAQALGSAGRMQEQGYDVRGGGWLEEVWGDARFAARLLRKHWMKTTIVVTTLAVGVGVNTAVFGVVRSVLLQPLPFHQAQDLVVLHQANHGQLSGVSYPHYRDWQTGNHSFTDIAVFAATSATLTGQGHATVIRGAIVSSSLFHLLGVQPLRGRLFRSEEDRLPAGAKTVNPVLLSDRLWQSRFGSRTDILGQTLSLDGHAFQVIGIIPAHLAFPVLKDGIDYWATVAIDADPALYGGSIPISRGYPRYDGALARLKPGITVRQAQENVNLLAKSVARNHPQATSADEVAVIPALEEVVGPASRTMILLLFGAVFCVLIVACLNVATILLVSAVERRREFAVRTALGAPARKLFRQVLIESLVVASLGGCTSLLISWSVLQLFPILAPPEMPRVQEIHLGPSTFFYVLAISLGSGLLFGCLPAFSAQQFALAASLKEGSRTMTRKASSLLRPGPLLICIQIALGMVLTCSAAVLLSSFYKILHSPRGFNPHGVLTASISLPIPKYGQGSDRVVRFYQSLLSDLRSLPNVQAAAIAEVLPLSQQRNSTTFDILGSSERNLRNANLRFVDPAYFTTLQMPLLNGRFFNKQDLRGRPPIMLVNQAFVQRFLPGKGPFWKEIRLGWGGDAPKRIVGVVGNILHDATSSAAEPEMYVPYSQFPLNDMSLLLRTTGDPRGAAASVQKIIYHLDP